MLYPVLQDPLRPVVSSLFDRPRGASIGQMLFGAGEQGGWYDPSDMSTLFQDAAGTTPVTAVEQPVGRILDKSGRGNHATQSTTTKRPVLSRRVNLVLNSEAEGGTGGTPGTAPTLWENHIYTGDYSHTVENGKHRFSAVAGRSTIRAPITWAANTQYRTTVRVTNNGPIAVTVTQTVYMGLQAGTGVALTAYVDGAIASSIPPGTHTVEVVGSYTGGTPLNFLYFGAGAGSTNTADVTLLSADVRLNIDASLPYQWVNTATDYDADPAKFPAYLRFDGVDDALQTGNIDFTSTDKMTVWAGVTKLSDAAAGMVLELGSDATTQTGSVSLRVPSAAAASNAQFISKGTAAFAAANAAPLGTPISMVLTGIGDIGGDIAAIMVNGIEVARNTADQGSGNYGNYTLFSGARNNSALFFNGRDYGKVIRGAQSSPQQLAMVNDYLKQQMRMP